MSEDNKLIQKIEREIDATGNIIKEKIVTVEGESLVMTLAIFNEIWKEEK